MSNIIKRKKLFESKEEYKEFSINYVKTVDKIVEFFHETSYKYGFEKDRFNRNLFLKSLNEEETKKINDLWDEEKYLFNSLNTPINEKYSGKKKIK